MIQEARRRVFLDTNVLLYAISQSEEESEKSRIANEIIVSERIVLSVQVLQEFYVQATKRTRKPRITHEDAVGLIQRWSKFEVVSLTYKLFKHALQIKQRYQISYWDAAVVAAAVSAGCGELFTEDLNAGQEYEGVRVVNPFG